MAGERRARGVRSIGRGERTQLTLKRKLGRHTMRMQPESIDKTLLFRLAQAVLPEATMLALFGRRVRVAMTPSPAELRRQLMRR